MSVDSIRAYRDYFHIPVKDEDLEKLPYVTFPEGSEEYKYLHEHRKALQGYVPAVNQNSVWISKHLSFPNSLHC